MHQANSAPSHFLERCIVWIGAVALVLLGLLICVSVGLRMVGAVIKGSSEIGEMLIIIVAATAIVTATLTDGHPFVHMLVEKISSRRRYLLAAIVSLVGAAFWATMAWVNGAVAIENARLIEETELLRISIIPFRWLWIVCLILVAAVLTMRAIQSFKARDNHNNL
jgi:TRAP-type C4-dicarboxylate transport system permease small subunit